MVHKNKLTPLSKGGRIDKQEGKGSQMAAMPDRREIKQLASGAGGINDYAKASPTMPSGGASARSGPTIWSDMAADLKKLSEIAGRWKNQDPRGYEEFLFIMERYVFDVTLAVTEASSTEILQAQGRAQQARKFLLLFTEHLEPRATSPQ